MAGTATLPTVLLADARDPHASADAVLSQEAQPEQLAVCGGELLFASAEPDATDAGGVRNLSAAPMLSERASHLKLCTRPNRPLTGTYMSRRRSRNEATVSATAGYAAQISSAASTDGT